VYVRGERGGGDGGGGGGNGGDGPTNDGLGGAEDTGSEQEAAEPLVSQANTHRGVLDDSADLLLGKGLIKKGLGIGAEGVMAAHAGSVEAQPGGGDQRPPEVRWRQDAASADANAPTPSLSSWVACDPI
jgi:hypothetical protein